MYILLGLGPVGEYSTSSPAFLYVMRQQHIQSQVVQGQIGCLRCSAKLKTGDSRQNGSNAMLLQSNIILLLEMQPQSPASLLMHCKHVTPAHPSISQKHLKADCSWIHAGLWHNSWREQSFLVQQAVQRAIEDQSRPKSNKSPDEIRQMQAEMADKETQVGTCMI